MTIYTFLSCFLKNQYYLIVSNIKLNQGSRITIFFLSWDLYEQFLTKSIEKYILYMPL